MYTIAQLQRWRERAGQHTVLANQGIPLREGLQILYKVHRDKFALELLWFFFFMSTFSYIIFEAYNVATCWEQDHALIDLFVDEEFEGSTYKKNFLEVQTNTEYWQWMEGPLLSGMYPTEWYDGQPLDADDRHYVLNYLRIVGDIEVRQERVSNESCRERRFVDELDATGQPRFDTLDGTCYSEFVLNDFIKGSTEDREPFGPPDDPAKYTWSPGHGSMWGLAGYGPSDYGDGGYVVNLPQNATRAAEIVAELKRDRFIDKGTRAVAVTFTVYNTNTRLATTARMLVEFYHTAAVQPSYVIFSYRLMLYASRSDAFRALLEVVYVSLWGYQVYKEARALWYTHPRVVFFLRIRNIFEVVYLSINFAMIVQWLRVLFDPALTEFSVSAPSRDSYFDLGYNYLVTFTLAAVNALLSCFKLFKYLSINKRMATLWLTLLRAGYDLAMFFLGFVIIIVGFAMAGNLCFGHIIRDFHNIPSSISTLTRFTLGDFKYDELSQARPRLAAPFFWTYTIVVFVVVLNMFIAIITKYFDQVHEEARTADRWKEGMPDLTWDMWKATRRWCRGRVKPRCVGAYNVCAALPCCRAVTADDDDVIPSSNPLLAASLEPVPKTLGGGGGSPARAAGDKAELGAGGLASGLGRGSGSDGGGMGGGKGSVAGAGSKAAQRMGGGGAMQHAVVDPAALKKQHERLELELWEREADLEMQMRRCARAARAHKHRSIDLHRYFETAYQEGRGLGNQYISLDELCQLSRDVPLCDHRDCVAKAVVSAYTGLKQVVLMGAEERKTGSANQARRARYVCKYTVTKVNKWGRRQKRIVAVDELTRELHSLDKHAHLRMTLPLALLVQLDISNVDRRRLRLVFDEGAAPTGGGVQYSLEFSDGDDRNKFKDTLLAIANKAVAEHKAKKLAAAGAAGDTAAAAAAAAAAAVAAAGGAHASDARPAAGAQATRLATPAANGAPSGADPALLKRVLASQDETRGEVRALAAQVSQLVGRLGVGASAGRGAADG